MDAERLAQIKAREKAATPEPWTANYNFSIHGARDCRWVASCRKENVPFLLHAREDIPWLVAQLEEAEAKLAVVEAAFQAASEEFHDLAKHGGEWKTCAQVSCVTDRVAIFYSKGTLSG